MGTRLTECELYAEGLKNFSSAFYALQESMPSIRVNGVNLYYEQEGGGPPLLLISGYTTDISAWTLIRRSLAAKYSLLMVDNRGSGRSDCPDAPYSIETMADDAKALIDVLNLKRPHVLPWAERSLKPWRLSILNRLTSLF